MFTNQRDGGSGGNLFVFDQCDQLITRRKQRQVVFNVSDRPFYFFGNLRRFPALINQALICSCSLQWFQCTPLTGCDHEGDAVSLTAHEIFAF